MHTSEVESMRGVCRVLEGNGCEVVRRGETLWVEVPGWDARLLPTALEMPFARLFWDRFKVERGTDDEFRFNWVYGSHGQLLVHVLISLLFLGKDIQWSALVLANSLPVLVSFGHSRWHWAQARNWLLNFRRR